MKSDFYSLYMSEDEWRDMLGIRDPDFSFQEQVLADHIAWEDKLFLDCVNAVLGI